MRMLLEQLLGLNNGVVSVMGSVCRERVKRAERGRLMFLAFFFFFSWNLETSFRISAVSNIVNDVLITEYLRVLSNVQPR